ncbi:MAG: CD3324 family protein [Lachnotalea sp.]
MNYKKAEKILPDELIAAIQNYVDGECIYIPRRNECKKNWGENTNIRQELEHRNNLIYEDYRNGIDTKSLAIKHCLSLKSIQRIVLIKKKNKIKPV